MIGDEDAKELFMLLDTDGSGETFYDFMIFYDFL